MQDYVKDNSAAILDIGCGLSPISPFPEKTTVTDISSTALSFLHKNTSFKEDVVASCNDLPWKENTFDSVLCSEVLEHLVNDRCAVEEFIRILKPGGQLIVTVPLHPYLFRFDDRFVGHQRRYKPEEIISILRLSGCEILERKKIMGISEKLVTGLLVRVFAKRRIRYRGKRKRQSIFSNFPWILFFRWFNRFLAIVMAVEARLTPLALTTVWGIHCRKKPRLLDDFALLANQLQNP